MKQVLEYIQTCRLAAESHPFYRRLARDEPYEDVLVEAAVGGAFWALAFQDLLRLNLGRIEDPRLREMIAAHGREERGHDQWLLTDLALLGVDPPSLRSAFGPRYQGVRDASYALIHEVLSATSDLERVVLLLAVESPAEQFFGATTEYTARVGVPLRLTYFARAHADAEAKHALHGDPWAGFLAAASISEAQRPRLRALVDAVYRGFAAALAVVDDNIAARRAGRATS